MNNNIWDVISKRIQAEDISERVALYKLFGGFIFAFAFYYFAVLHHDNSAVASNKVFGIELTDAGFSLVLSALTVLLVILLAAKKSDPTK